MRFLIYLFFFYVSLNAHPLNMTKMNFDLNGSKSVLDLRFVSFNLETPLFLKNPTSKILYAKKDEIIKYIQKSIDIKNDNSECSLKPLSFNVHNEIVINSSFNVICKQPVRKLRIKFDLFFEFDKTQQGVMKIKLPKGSKTLIFSPRKKIYTIKTGDYNSSKFKYFKNFLIEGIWHIWEGIDHILFLLMLLLPSVLTNSKFKVTLLDVLKIVTAFTLSHSITLSLSMFNILNPPEKIIETFIAISVLLTAINNIYSIVSFKKEWILAFCFGFIHGFGFANALHELNLKSENFASIVFGFNIGVEIGQIIIVLAILPLIYLASYKKFYKRFIVPSLSSITALISLLWAIDRAFSLHFMPF